jgi:hypothetical protein
VFATIATIATIALLIPGQTAISETSIRAFAMREVPKRFEDYLKAPGSAKYGVKEVSKAEPKTAFPPNRYVVEGWVDASNSFGAVTRGQWKAGVVIDDANTMAVYMVTYAESSGDAEKLVYVGPASIRYRKDIYDQVHADFKAVKAKVAEQVKRYPAKKRAMFVTRNTLQFVEAERKKFDLTVPQVNEILGLDKK